MPRIGADSNPLRSPWAFAVAAGAIAGIAVRVYMVHGPIGVLDSDEAVVGLMARHFSHGSYRAFFWGQSYGGTIETVLTSLVFRVVGTSTAALKAVPAGLDAVAAVLVWRIGLRLMRPAGAVAAGLLVWLWPANYVWWSIKARGFYEAALCITLAAVLIVLRLDVARRRTRPWEWAGFGLLVGLGWWQTPQVLYIIAPASAWLLLRGRVRIEGLLMAVGGAVVGALPWLVANVDSGFASLSPPKAPLPGSYTDHLTTFFRTGLPMTFGLKRVYDIGWLGDAHVSTLAFAAGIAVVVVGVLQRRRMSALLGLIILAYPFLHAILTLSSDVAEGRYTLFLSPWLALALARACDRRQAAIAALFAVALTVSLLGVRDLRGHTSPYAPDKRVPTSMATLERSLAEHGVTRVWANYWIAYRLTFETRERVIAASALNPRYPRYNDEVSAGRGVAYVFIASSRDVHRFRGWLQAHQVAFDEWSVGPTWEVFVPADGKVLPSIVPGVSL